MGTEASNVDGCKLTTVTVNAASPDVVGALMKQITEAVMKAIPEGAIEKIAEEMIKEGKVVYERTQRGYSYSSSKETVIYELSVEARTLLAELLGIEIKRQVEAYLAEDSTKAQVAEAVFLGVAQALQDAPRWAAKVAGERMGYVLAGQFSPVDANVAIPLLLQNLRATQQALMAKNLINQYDIQGFGGNTG